MPDGEALTTTHLLTEKNLDFPPKDKDGKALTCGLYTFTDASKARGPETSKETFDVSWKNEVRGCMYEDATNYNPVATVDDKSCTFDAPGCIYATAVNYDADATTKAAPTRRAPHLQRRMRRAGRLMDASTRS